MEESSSDDFVSSSRISLLESVCNGKQSKQVSKAGMLSYIIIIRSLFFLKDICESWIRLYRHAPVAALVKFIQFVLEASGSQYQMPSGKELPVNYSEVLIAATARFGNVSALLTSLYMFYKHFPIYTLAEEVVLSVGHKNWQVLRS